MQRIGRYELERPIGSGGMAEVWLAHQRGVFAGASKTVAVKLMADHLAADPGFQRLFEAEVRLSMLLSHSNVVQVFDAGREDGRTYLVMEWVQGVDLAKLEDFVRRSGTPLPVDVAVHIVAEILRGLAYAHRVELDGRPAGIVHRDVSPHNVLVSVSGEVKLTDFGVAKLAIDKTTVNDVRGKLRYMAPEQAQGRSRSQGVDLWSVGAILHELLAGERFRGAQDLDALRIAVLGGEVPMLPRAVPPEVEALRRGLLEPDPSRRLQSAGDALAAIEAWPGFRGRTEAVASLCRHALESASIDPAHDRTDRGRWAGIDGTATQTATAAGFARTPTHTAVTVAPNAVASPPKSNAGVGIAIVLGALLASAALVTIVVFSMSDVEGDASRYDTVVTHESAPPPPSGAAQQTERRVLKDAPVPEPWRAGPRSTRPLGTVEPEEETLRDTPATEAVQAVLAERDPIARKCGPLTAMLQIEIAFIGESGFASAVRVQGEPDLDPTQRECIEEAYVGATVPRFRAETQRVVHVLRP